MHQFAKSDFNYKGKFHHFKKSREEKRAMHSLFTRIVSSFQLSAFILGVTEVALTHKLPFSGSSCSLSVLRVWILNSELKATRLLNFMKMFHLIRAFSSVLKAGDAWIFLVGSSPCRWSRDLTTYSTLTSWHLRRGVVRFKTEYSEPKLLGFVLCMFLLLFEILEMWK